MGLARKEQVAQRNKADEVRGRGPFSAEEINRNRGYIESLKIPERGAYLEATSIVLRFLLELTSDQKPQRTEIEQLRHDALRAQVAQIWQRTEAAVKDLSILNQSNALRTALDYLRGISKVSRPLSADDGEALREVAEISTNLLQLGLLQRQPTEPPSYTLEVTGINKKQVSDVLFRVGKDSENNEADITVDEMVNRFKAVTKYCSKTAHSLFLSENSEDIQSRQRHLLLIKLITETIKKPNEDSLKELITMVAESIRRVDFDNLYVSKSDWELLGSLVELNEELNTK